MHRDAENMSKSPAELLMHQKSCFENFHKYSLESAAGVFKVRVHNVPEYYTAFNKSLSYFTP